MVVILKQIKWNTNPWGILAFLRGTFQPYWMKIGQCIWPNLHYIQLEMHSVPNAWSQKRAVLASLSQSPERRPYYSFPFIPWLCCVNGKWSPFSFRWTVSSALTFDLATCPLYTCIRHSCSSVITYLSRVVSGRSASGERFPPPRDQLRLLIRPWL